MGASPSQVEPLLGLQEDIWEDIQEDIREGIVVAFLVSPVNKAGPGPTVRSREVESQSARSLVLSCWLGGVSRQSAQPELGDREHSLGLCLSFCPQLSYGTCPSLPAPSCGLSLSLLSETPRKGSRFG